MRCQSFYKVFGRKMIKLTIQSKVNMCKTCNKDSIVTTPMTTQHNLNTAVRAKSRLRDTITQTWYYHYHYLKCIKYYVSVILSWRRDTLYISMLTKYHTDVIVSCRHDLALTNSSWVGYENDCAYQPQSCNKKIQLF